MTKVELHKVKRPRPPGKDGKARRPREVWMLRWVADGKRYGETIGDCKTMSRRDAAAVRREKQSKYDCKVESPKRPKKMTLAVFRPFYLDRRRRGDAVKLAIARVDLDGCVRCPDRHPLQGNLLVHSIDGDFEGEEFGAFHRHGDIHHFECRYLL